jgi:hypothetical protein
VVQIASNTKPFTAVAADMLVEGTGRFAISYRPCGFSMTSSTTPSLSVTC